jgi:hypothetical protein
MKEKLTTLGSKLAMATVEADKVLAGNKSAGTRLRALMQEIKVLVSEVRNAVLEVRKA